MESGLVKRRFFLKQASVVALSLPALDLSVVGLLGCTGQSQPSGTSEAAPVRKSVAAPWSIVTVSDKEPGEPLIVSGTIYAPDGRTALEGINLFVYQTDATGHYSTSGGDNRNTRIHGLMKTNADGRYEFRTIKPVSYPNTRNPAHIHAYVSGPDYPEYWIDEYLFADDPLVNEEQRQKDAGQGSFASILKLTRGADGVLRGVRDIKVERCSRNCTGK